MTLGTLVILAEVPRKNRRAGLHWRKKSALKNFWGMIIRSIVHCSPTATLHGQWSPQDGYRPATKGEKRRVVVTHYRTKLGDPDSLGDSTAELIIDNLKLRRYVTVPGYRKRLMETGLGLIYDDDLRHLKFECYQHPVAVDRPSVKVEIFTYPRR